MYVKLWYFKISYTCQKKRPYCIFQSQWMLNIFDISSFWIVHHHYVSNVPASKPPTAAATSLTSTRSPTALEPALLSTTFWTTRLSERTLPVPIPNMTAAMQPTLYCWKTPSTRMPMVMMNCTMMKRGRGLMQPTVTRNPWPNRTTAWEMPVAESRPADSMGVRPRSVPAAAKYTNTAEYDDVERKMTKSSIPWRMVEGLSDKIEGLVLSTSGTVTFVFICPFLSNITWFSWSSKLSISLLCALFTLPFGPSFLTPFAILGTCGEPSGVSFGLESSIRPAADALDMLSWSCWLSLGSGITFLSFKSAPKTMVWRMTAEERSSAPRQL